MATAITPISYGASIPVDGNASTSKAESTLAPDKSTFLKLLVAQIKNQNPLNPSDGAQFVAQLAQFSQLEETMAIKADLKAIREAMTASSDSSLTGQSTSSAAGEQAKGAK